MTFTVHIDCNGDDVYQLLTKLLPVLNGLSYELHVQSRPETDNHPRAKVGEAIQRPPAPPAQPAPKASVYEAATLKSHTKDEDEHKTLGRGSREWTPEQRAAQAERAKGQKKPPFDSDFDSVKADFDSGMSLTAIGRKWRCSEGHIRNCLSRHGVNPRRTSPAAKKVVNALRAESMKALNAEKRGKETPPGKPAALNGRREPEPDDDAMKVEAYLKSHKPTICPPMATRSLNLARATKNDAAIQPLSMREEPDNDLKKLACAKILAMLKLIGGSKEQPGNPSQNLIAINEARRWFFEPNRDFEQWCDDAGFEPEFVRQKARQVEADRMPEPSRHKPEKVNIAEMARYAEVALQIKEGQIIMTMERCWIPAVDDPKLERLHAKRYDVYAIADALGFSAQTIRKQMKRLDLTPHQRVPLQVTDKAPPPPKEKPDPLKVAGVYLQGFNRDTMTLRGQPIKLREVMRKTNAVLKGLGLSQLAYNEEWRV